MARWLWVLSAAAFVAGCGSSDGGAAPSSDASQPPDGGAPTDSSPSSNDGAGARDSSSSTDSGNPDAPDANPFADDQPFAAMRAACTFTQGALPSQTFGPSIANLSIPIDTIVIASQENRPFDQYLGQLPAYGQADVNVENPNVKLVGTTGMSYSPFHNTAFCTGDTAHDWDSMHKDWNNGANDGFVKVNDPGGNRTLGYYDATDLTFYYDLASTYGVGDAYFSGLLGPTGPNRLYLYAATSSGHIANGPGVASGQPSIFKRLKDAGVSFAVYSNASGPATNCPGPYSFETSIFCADIPQGAKTFAQFQADATAGTLPHVVWIYAGSDEHPPSDIQIGESDVQKFFDALVASPQWARAAFILTYDEAGGMYDHAPPPSACKPDAIPPNIPAEGSYPGQFDRYGFRVPFIVASPWSKPHYVSHQVSSHTSLLRFLELRFKLPACSNRDANEFPLIDYFDFSQPHFATPHVPAPVVVLPPSSKGC